MNQPPFYPLRPRIKLGRVSITPAALAALQSNGMSIMNVLVRHICGDWGDVSDDARHQNDLSVATGLRILSVYTLPKATEILVITEWDRSSTTVLLPDDY